MIEDDPFKSVEAASDFYANAFRKFIFRRAVIDTFPNDLVDPSELRLQRPRQSFLEGEHATAAELLVQEVSNRINELFRAVIGLKTWEKILSEYNATERYYLEDEFVSPLLQLALAEVSGIKNQITFTVAKVAIHLESFNSEKSLPVDGEIGRKDWEGWTEKWQGREKFRTSLGSVNTRPFLAVTHGFRNRRAHSIARSFFGIIPGHQILREGKDWKMSIRYEEALNIHRLIAALAEQHLAISALFKEMCDFIRIRFEAPENSFR